MCLWANLVRTCRDADFPFFLLFLAQSVLRRSVSRSPFSLFSPISSFSFWTFCLFLCSFSVSKSPVASLELGMMIDTYEVCFRNVDMYSALYKSVWSKLGMTIDDIHLYILIWATLTSLMQGHRCAGKQTFMQLFDNILSRLGWNLVYVEICWFDESHSFYLVQTVLKGETLLMFNFLFHSKLCPSSAGSSPPPESPNFLCPLLSLSIPLPVAPQCLLSQK